MEKKKNGFTLIELLAVIIILGILMLVAIPSVTRYISDSRKEAYINTAKQYIKGATNRVNTGELDMFDPETTYYIPVSAIKLESGGESPYGKFTQAYISVIYDGDGYKYYWISVDSTGQGVGELKLSDNLSTEDIVSGLKSLEIENKVKTTGIGSRSTILILENGSWSSPYQVEHFVSEDGGEYNGLTYNGVPISNSTGDLLHGLESKCLGQNINSSQLGITFEATSENSADISIDNYFTSQADVGLFTSVSIETDAETGDSRVVVGSCSINSQKLANLNLSKFLNNGEPVTRDYLREVAMNRCSEIRETLESLDTECIKKLIGEP